MTTKVNNGVIDVLLDRSWDMGLSFIDQGKFESREELGDLFDEVYPWNVDDEEKSELIQELLEMTEWLDAQELLSEIAIDYRVKSMDSILLKYDRYYPDHQTRKVFNDILGFRAFCDNYDDVRSFESEQFRVADMSMGKANDDGYRGVHVYYQKSGRHYPIEIQFNTLFDRQLNNWLHDYLYKKSLPNSVGRTMRNKYESGLIRDDNSFKEVLEDVLSDCERS